MALKTIKEKIFPEIPLEVAYSQPCTMHSHSCCETVQHWMTCYNLSGDPKDDPTNINILESEGSCVVEGSNISNEQFIKPLKTKKVNIGLEETLKFANIGDYNWDKETVAKIIDLLHKFQDLFPTNFKEMKGIVGDLGEMKILLRPNGRTVKQSPYRLNPCYKEKVKAKMDCMMEAGIIEPIEELEWISPIVIQDKKETGECCNG